MKLYILIFVTSIEKKFTKEEVNKMICDSYNYYLRTGQFFCEALTPENEIYRSCRKRTGKSVKQLSLEDLIRITGGDKEIVKKYKAFVSSLKFT